MPAKLWASPTCLTSSRMSRRKFSDTSGGKTYKSIRQERINVICAGDNFAQICAKGFPARKYFLPVGYEGVWTMGSFQSRPFKQQAAFCNYLMRAGLISCPQVGMNCSCILAYLSIRHSDYPTTPTLNQRIFAPVIDNLPKIKDVIDSLILIR